MGWVGSSAFGPEKEGVSPWVSAGGQQDELLLETVLAPLSLGFSRGLAAWQHLPSPHPFILSTNARMHRLLKPSMEPSGK